MKGDSAENDHVEPILADRNAGCSRSVLHCDVVAGDAYLRAKDMAAFLAMLLNGGTCNGRRILSEASTAEIVKAQFEGSNSGLGINVSEMSGRRVVTKNGIFTGYHSFMIGDPATRGVYVVSNSTAAGGPIAQLGRFALRLLWGEQPEPLRR
jgi:CubicO group peptidase (beta-lactamase class C family)